MAQPIYTQTIVAMIWDFDRTLIPGYSQEPIFEAYGVDASTFWAEVNGLEELYESRDLKVAPDTAYLLHMLTYVREGKFSGLTNSKLRELGAQLQMCPGMPEFLEYARTIPTESERYRSHGIVVEHYIISTGIRHLIQGSSVGALVDGVWANEFVDQPPPPGYTPGNHTFAAQEGEIAQVGYMLDNTSKTRAIFEINKGPGVDVNSRISESDRRVPIRNMIYIADGPSDVPVFSIIGHNGGRRLGVFQRGKGMNFPEVKQLEDDARVDSIAEADYQQGTQAWMWLDATIREIVDRVCSERERYLEAIKPSPRHVVS